VVYRKDIVDLSGDYLSSYETVRLTVELSPEDRALHDEERALYRAFLERAGIRMSGPSGWSDFIIRSSRTDEGRRAMLAYRRQRELAFAAPAKLDYVALLLDRHRADRALLFTQDNATAYEVSRRFLVPVITHETKVRERSEILAGLADGGYGAIVTSKVLNEGVDIPSANVAIVISGSASVREHVQRLGRILRPQNGKHALLYELVTARTTETSTSARRREHSAYR
jgi:superfamily II DNA or RNA helicase